MTNRQFATYYIAFLQLAIVLVILYSWVGGFMGHNVDNLLTARGMRWMLSNFVSNSIQTSILGYIFVGLFSFDTFIGSELPSDMCAFMMPNRFRRTISLKRQRALVVTHLALLLYIILIAAAILFPHAILLSVNGTIEGSAFSKGLFGIVCFALFLSGVIYGLSIGRYRSGSDIVESSTITLHRNAYYFLICFLVSQFNAVSSYIGVYDVFSIGDTLKEILFDILYLCPLAFFIVKRR